VSNLETFLLETVTCVSKDYNGRQHDT